MLRKIASFTVNHDTLVPGLYVSRIDGDCVTYDLRMKKPNGGDYLGQGALHTLEHLLATFIRSSDDSDAVIYVGPMGCRTGFYLIVRDSVSRRRVLEICREAFAFDREKRRRLACVCGGLHREHPGRAAHRMRQLPRP